MNWEKNYIVCREEANFFELKDYKIVQIIGPDAANVLQGQSTSDVLKLGNMQTQLSALLTPQGQIISHHYLIKFSNEKIFLLIHQDLSEGVREHLDKHIIMEDAEVSLLDQSIWHLYNDKSLIALELNDLSQGHVYENDSGSLICAGFLGPESSIFISNSYSFDAVEMKEETFHAMRMEAGFAIYPYDFDQKTLLSETGLQIHCVSFDKGCFTGQEIVARVKYRGSVNKHLNALISDNELSGMVCKASLVDRDENKLGVYRHSSWSPTLQKYIVFAYLAKKYRKQGELLKFIDAEGNDHEGEVHSLPPVENAESKVLAQQLYHQALELFVSENEENDIQAEPLLKRALYLDPSYEDAYEALGVILSRHERFDEAIELMKRLKELNPNVIMAYTNLSVFYMKKGLIQEAEDEKQEGTLATFRIAAAKRKERIKSEDLDKKAQLERDRRRAMFVEVLGIDEDDLAANYGLGKIELEEKNAGLAKKFFKKCLEIKADYSAACTLLARAYILNDEIQLAKDLLKKGVGIAHEKGELMPKQEMEMLLMKLEGKVN